MTQLDEAKLDTHNLDLWLSDFLEGKSRGAAETADAHLWQVGDVKDIPRSKTNLRVHYLKKDANGNVRVAPLASFLATKIVDYCIPRSLIEIARKIDNKNGSTDAVMQLRHEAKNLFAAVKNSGEGGELLLYFLLETVLQIPQILCKMPLKTNSNVHYHGVDGVHAKVVNASTLAVYWGESKLYADPIKGIRACLESITPFLLDDGTGASQRDRLLVRDNLDLNDPDIESALKLFFDHTQEESTRLQFRAACLVGFSRKDYPHPFAVGGDGSSYIIEDVLAEIETWSSVVGKNIEYHNLADIEIEFFCIPFPDIETFRRSIFHHLDISEKDK